MGENNIQSMRGRGYGSRTPRRLPDTYNFDVTRAMPYRGTTIVNLEQFEFLKDFDPAHLGPRGSGYTKAVKRGGHKVRTSRG